MRDFAESKTAALPGAGFSGGRVTVKILLIEDSADFALFVETHLKKADANSYRLSHVTRLSDGLRLLSREHFDAVLLDLGLPDSQGLDTLRLLQATGFDVPVIVLSGVNDEELSLTAVEHGAHDFLEKSQLTATSLVRSLRYAQERHRLMVALRDQAFHDSLTGLPNRVYFDEQVERAVSESAHTRVPFSVLCFDLDGFKAVNDLGGHETGDRLLKQVAERLKRVVRREDVLARVGGDEFSAIVYGVAERNAAESVAGRFHQAFSSPFIIDDQRFNISTSIGIAAHTSPVDDDSVPATVRVELLRDADTAMYAAKAQGPRRTQYFDQSMRDSLVERTLMEQKLHDALHTGELKVHYQPIVNLETRETLGLEALCRWMPDGGKPVSPAVFIPIAEQTGLIQPIGRWVLQQACADYAMWKQSTGHAPLGIHVNVSRVQLSDAQLLPAIRKAIADNDLEPGELTIEVTESCIIDEKVAMPVFQEILNLGVGLAIDDFGVGYSSLGHLRRFPFDRIKIDRTFIAQLSDTDREPGLLLEAITTLATCLGLETIAEGVETEFQTQYLRDIGCTFAQGFLFARPAPIEELCQLMHVDLC